MRGRGGACASRRAGRAPKDRISMRSPPAHGVFRCRLPYARKVKIFLTSLCGDETTTLAMQKLQDGVGISEIVLRRSNP